MKALLFKNWHLVRVLQLLMGLFALGDFFFFSGEGVVLLFGGLLLLQAITDFQFGCARGCTVRSDSAPKEM